MLGCSEEPSETQQIADNLREAGFPDNEILVVGGKVYAGRDAVVSLAASRELLGVDGDSSHEQYRTTNQVGANVRNICVNGAAFAGDFSTALDMAIENYNALALRHRMTRTSGNTAGCDATITANVIAGDGGVAGFPSNGLPYHEINIGSQLTAYDSVDLIERVITHELGHCRGSEDAAPEGAILIPGTPSGAMRNGSLMNACADIDATGEFTTTDLTALNALYGSPPTWGAASSWSGAFNDTLGWGGAKAMWSSIKYPDVNGDGRADVCGRTPNGVQCAR